MNKKIYHISGFDCPSCANKTEAYLNKQDNIEYCHIDFSTNKMYITFKDKELSIADLLLLISKVESDPIELNELDTKKAEKITLFTKNMWFLLARVVFAIFVLIFNMAICPMFDDTGWIRFAVYLVASLLLIYDVSYRVFVHIKNLNNIIDHNLLITITLFGASILSFICLSEQNIYQGVDFAMEGMMVVALFQVGQIVEKVATNKSKNAVMSAIQLRVEYANLLESDQIFKVEPEQVEIGNIVVVSAGEMIPVDGQIIAGSAYIDKSSLTGEFVPILADINHPDVLAGFLVKSGSIKVKVLKKYQDSAVAKIVDLIAQNGEKKSKADEFIAKFAKYYTPAIVLLSILVFIIGGFITQNWRDYVVMGLEILVTGCPCAIVISVPLAYFSAIGLASKNGIVIKGTNYMDEINNVDIIFTDKTGTLTHGVFTISKIQTVNNVTEDELFVSLLAAESLSNHPIAKAICHDQDIKEIAALQNEYREIPGKGVETIYKDQIICAGSYKYMKELGVEFDEVNEEGTIVYCIKDGEYLGYVVLNDTIKKEAFDMVNLLHKQNMEVVLLTGDKTANAVALQKQLKIDRIYAELKPDEKTLILQDEMEKGHNVGFVGDGINDAPSIKLSNVGFAMGAIGSDIAVSNADVVIMNDNPAKVYQAVKIARIARITAIFNIIFALFIKALVAILVLIPQIEVPMMIPVIADTGLTVVLVLNSLLVLYRKMTK